MAHPRDSVNHFQLNGINHVLLAAHIYYFLNHACKKGKNVTLPLPKYLMWTKHTKENN